MYNLDRCTHRYLIEPVSQCLHPKVMIASRYVTFHKSLVNSKKFPVRFLARLNEMDYRTVLGRTLNSIADQCGVQGLECLSATQVKKKCSYFLVPEAEQWRLPILQELLEIRSGNLLTENLNKNEVDVMIENICVTSVT